MSVASIKLPRNTWGDKARLPARSLEARFAMDVHVLLSHMPLSLVSHCIFWRYSPQFVAAVRLTQRIIVRSSGVALHVRCACSAHLRVRFPIPIHILSRICLFRPSAPRPLLHLSLIRCVSARKSVAIINTKIRHVDDRHAAALAYS